MPRYVYDGTFTGLLTVIHEGFRDKEVPQNIISRQNYNLSLFTEAVVIESEEKKADQVTSAIKNKISQKVHKDIYHAFLSEIPDIELNIYNYLLLCFQNNDRSKNNRRSEDIKKVKSAASKVRKERHRFKGLLRFRELQDGTLYAPFKPDYNITGLLAPHFADRLATENGVIHDKKRDIAAFFASGEWELLDSSNIPSPEKQNFAEKEENYQQLWQNFFDNIAIEERKNLQLQKSLMPKKYWEFLIEK